MGFASNGLCLWGFVYFLEGPSARGNSYEHPCIYFARCNLHCTVYVRGQPEYLVVIGRISGLNFVIQRPLRCALTWRPAIPEGNLLLSTDAQGWQAITSSTSRLKVYRHEFRTMYTL